MNLSLFLFLHQGKDTLCRAIKRHLRQWARPDNHPQLLNSAVDLTRSKSELVLENMLLRQQVIVLKRQGKRPVLSGLDRVLFVLLGCKMKALSSEAALVLSPRGALVGITTDWDVVLAVANRMDAGRVEPLRS